MADHNGTAGTASAIDVDALAVELGLSEQDKIFALARVKGVNRTQAARLAGFLFEEIPAGPGREQRIRSKGSELDKRQRIQKFIGQVVEAAESGKPMPILSRVERKRLLSKDAKSADAQTRRAAIAELNRMDGEDHTSRNAIEFDGFADWRAIRDFVKEPHGAAAIVMMYPSVISGSGTLASIPLLHDVHRRIFEDGDGDIWHREVSKLSETSRAEIKKCLADHTWQISARVKIWREIGVEIDTRGLSIELDSLSVESDAEPLAAPNGNANQQSPANHVNGNGFHRMPAATGSAER